MLRFSIAAYFIIFAMIAAAAPLIFLSLFSFAMRFSFITFIADADAFISPLLSDADAFFRRFSPLR